MKENLLERLKKEFDRVIIRHDVENRRSVAILVRGSNVHVGISKIHEKDDLNRYKGRMISLGRAKRASEVYEGKLQLREREQRRAEPLGFTLEGTPETLPTMVDELVTGQFFVAYL